MMNEDGTPSEQYNTKEQLQTIYNNNITVTRDKLPDLKKLTEDYKKKLNEKQKAAKAAADKKAAAKTTTAATTAPNA